MRKIFLEGERERKQVGRKIFFTDKVKSFSLFFLWLFFFLSIFTCCPGEEVLPCEEG